MQAVLENLQIGYGELNARGFPCLRVLRARGPVETAQILRDLMEAAFGSRTDIAPLAVLPVPIPTPRRGEQARTNQNVASVVRPPSSIVPPVLEPHRLSAAGAAAVAREVAAKATSQARSPAMPRAASKPETPTEELAFG